jgi:hypothetical protein
MRGSRSAHIYQILSNPAEATRSNLAGITHVASRMEWYCALAGHLLDEDTTVVGKESLEPNRNLLQDKIVEFYGTLLLYQMKSVCSYYRNQGLEFLRGLVDLDKWNDDVQSVINAEDTLLKDWDKYNTVKAAALSRGLFNLTKEIETKLGDIHQTLENFIVQQKEMHMDAKKANFLDDLFMVDPQYDVTAIESNKDNLLDAAYNWILGNPAYKAFTNWSTEDSATPPCRLLWIKGHAGTGKTMLLIGIIRELSGQSAVLAPNISHFFCQSTVNTRNTATATLRSLMWMLLLQQTHLITGLLEKFRVPLPKLLEDESAFYALSDAFKRMLKDLSSPVYFIVDALDECDQGSDHLIELITTSLTLSDKVRWLVSSRPDVDVLSKLENPNISRVVDLDAERLDGPVNAYIEHKLSTLKGRDGYELDTRRAIADGIHGRAGNSFLWAALVFKTLDSVDGWDAVKTIAKIPPGLSKLYDHMMTKIEEGNKDNQQRCKNVLVATTLAYRPLSFSELEILAELPRGSPRAIIKKCGSFLTTKGETVFLIHQSAKDYLDKNRSGLWPGGVGQGHAYITKHSVGAMLSILKGDIYGSQQYGFRSKDTTPPEEDPLAPIRYSCVFWLDHLCDAIKGYPENSKKLCDLGFKFLKEHFLHWLESLGLLFRLSHGIISIRKLLNVVKVCL